VGIDSDLFVSPRPYCVFAECPPQDVKRLSERCAGVLLIGVGPEQSEERVTPMESVRLRNAKIRQEGNALRLSEQ
jgi:hypothetical protein